MFLSRIIIKLILVSELLIGLNSCTPKVLRGLEKTSLKTVVNLPSVVIYTAEGQANYRCKIEAFDQHISGVMIFKEIKDSENRAESDRVVMITDFGLKVIDVSFSQDGSYVINHIMKHLDYKFLRESFALNISMALGKQIPIGTEIYQDSSYLIYPLASQLFFQKNDQTVKVERYRGENKMIVSAIVQENGEIDIQQFNPKINMKLIPIK